MSKVLVFTIGHQHFIGPAELLPHLDAIAPLDLGFGGQAEGYRSFYTRMPAAAVEVRLVDESEIRDPQPKPEPQLDPASEPAPTGEAA